MAHLHHVGFGWPIPLVSYATACVGAALGLRCAVRALAVTAARRHRLLAAAAVGLGSGVWTMHLVALLGFTVDTTELCRQLPHAALGLPVAVLAAGLGVLTVAHGRHRGRALLLGGLITGLGVAAVHHLGTAAVRPSGHLRHEPGAVVVPVLLAVGASTAALWAATTLRNGYAAAAAALLMGVAVSLMHGTGTATTTAVRPEYSRTGAGGVESGGGSGVGQGEVGAGVAEPVRFVVPLAAGLGSLLFLTAASVALSPPAQERAARREAGQRAIEEVRLVR
ncbi:MHYT domain-containing protein [Kitasatospora sp. NPDC096147]|uniref:MHYT domain-containing protein n=1 Tax=Kitasatospora sp. NPDC096147 TaxID=3364093 RepID=UPI003817FFA7